MIWPAKLTIFAIVISKGVIMKFKCGDAVRFLNDIGGGVVNRIDDRGNVYVLTEDGFEIPVPEKELVISKSFNLDESDATETRPTVEVRRETRKPAEEKPKKPAELPRNVPQDAPVQFLLGFIPEVSGPILSNNLACYLINDSEYAANYHLGMKEGGAFYYLSSGLIEAETKCFIKTFDQTSISKISDIHIQLVLINEGKYKKKEPVDKLVNLNLVNFSKESYYRNNDYFEEKALLFNILSGLPEEPQDGITVPEDIKEIKQKADVMPDNRPKKREPSPDTLEVDLHVDELTLQNSQYSPAGILALQMSRFHSAIEEATGKRLRRLVIIHGLGQGTLKMQIRKELQEKYPQFVYQDASFKEYGFGATLVYLTIEK